MKILIQIFMITILLTSATHAAQQPQTFNDGIQARNELASRMTMLLQQDKFDELENIALDYRENKVKFPDGQWKLFYFYKGLCKPQMPSEIEWTNLFARLERWRKAYPTSRTAHIAIAESWLNFAWYARGSGFSDSVSDQNRRLYNERVQKANDILMNLPKGVNDCPHRYQLLMRVGHNQGWERIRYEALFKEAVAFEPTYYEYFVSMANYLLPRWYGKNGDWEQFATNAYKTTPSSDGMTVYTLIVVGLWQKGFTWRTFEEARISWPMMKQGFVDMEKNYPDSPSNLNTFCFFASLAGDKEIARKLFNRIGNDPYIEVWQNKEIFDSFRKWALN